MPNRREAIKSAQIAFDDAVEALEEARHEAAVTKDVLEKKEKIAAKAISRKTAELENQVKQDLEDNLEAAERSAKSGLAIALDEAELGLREEMAERVRQVKKDFEEKIEDTHRRIKEEHAVKAEEEKKKIQEDADAKIEDARARAEEDEAPLDERDAAKRAANKLREEEDRANSARKRLENLTGKQVSIPEPKPERRADPPPKQTSDDRHDDRPLQRRRPAPRDGRDDPRDGRDGRREPPPQRGGGREKARERSYSEYSDEAPCEQVNYRDL